MFVSKLGLADFRNYESLELSPGAGINIFHGDNGQGKTNILESVFYSSIGRSFRSGRDNELIRAGASGFSVFTGISSDINESIEIRYASGGEKSIKVNGLYLRKLGQLMGTLLTVIFSPEDLQLVNSGPSARRKMLDIAVSQITPVHFYNLQQYGKVIRQKNNLLRDMSISSVSGTGELIDVYNEQLSRFGCQILLKRLEFSEKLKEYAAACHKNISGGEIFNVTYESDCIPEGFKIKKDTPAAEYAAAIKEYMLSQLDQRRDREIERQQSLCGPHHDDLKLELGGTDLRRFGSQGQKRTAVLALKLSELEIIKRSTGRVPVLLLDDVFSELDASRCRLLLESIKNCQTFITCTSPVELPETVLKDAEMFLVKGGSIIQ